MSANYSGRRPVNVSQYIANLNTIPSAAEMAQQQPDFGNFDDDLALFTNTEFFDFDINGPVPEMPAGMGYQPEQQQRQPVQTVAQDGAKNMGFVNQPNFQFSEFSQYPQQPQPINHISPHSLPLSPPNGINAYGAPMSQPTIPPASAFNTIGGPNIGDKRKSTSASLPSAADLEEASRQAAEEDKRRRNTAASARFRVKKKQREQALEKSAKEMSDKVAKFEARISQLELENNWLKSLITEKNMGRMPEMPVMAQPAVEVKKTSEEEDLLAAKKEADEEEEREEQLLEEELAKDEAERSTDPHTVGVGTEAVVA